MSEDVLLSDSESFHSGVSEKDFKETFKLHYLVWCNDYDDVSKYIRSPSFDMFEFERVDQRGRTPLHIAISFGHFEIARLLLASGANPTSKNAGGWSALHEATSIGDPELVIEILVNRASFRKINELQGRSAFLKHFFSMPDLYLEMKWEITSMIPLVGRFCPSDTMKIWKKGANIRADFHLVGMEKMSFKKGSKSILFKLNEKSKSPSGEIVEVDHIEKTASFESWTADEGNVNTDKVTPLNPRFINLQTAQRLRLEKAVQHRLTNPIKLSSVDPQKIKIERAKSGIWGFQSDKKENISGYDCDVYSINGVELLQRTRIEHCEENQKADGAALKRSSSSSSGVDTFGQILGVEKGTKLTDTTTKSIKQTYNPDGLSAEEYFNPTPETEQKDIGRPKIMKEKRQSFKGSAWITENSPISLVDELIPILDILCNFNDIPWFDSLREMLKLIPKGFPVRLDIPLFYVFTARVTFQNINEEGDFCQKDNDGKLKIDDKVFRIPGEYQQEHRNLQDTISEHRRNRRDTNFDDIELNAAIEESLKELGVSNDPATRRQIIETQRQAQHDLNMRMDEDEALQEAIKRSLNC